jgi:hypothetical protein
MIDFKIKLQFNFQCKLLTVRGGVVLAVLASVVSAEPKELVEGLVADFHSFCLFPYFCAFTKYIRPSLFALSISSSLVGSLFF